MELILIGLIGGFLSGLLGLGGGIIIVPSLMYFDMNIKSAIFLSITHMFFVSLFKTISNVKNKELHYNDFKYIMYGALFGGISSSFLIECIYSEHIFYLFLTILSLSYLKTIMVLDKKYNIFKRKREEVKTKIVKIKNSFYISYIVSSLSLTAGLGGSILMYPLLLKYFGKTTKEAINLNLVFLMSATSLSFLMLVIDDVNKLSITTVYMLSGSLIGVLFGSKVMKKANSKVLDISLFLVLNLIVLSLISK